MDETSLRSARLHIPAEKLTKYLLSPDHPAGYSKARFFLSHGFEPASLSAALGELVRTGAAVEKELTIHGTKYVIDGEVDTPGGSKALLRSVWMNPENSEALHFVTAYPGRRKR